MGREATANNPSCHAGAPEWTEAIAFLDDRALWTGLQGVGEATGVITRRDDAVLTACAAC